MMARIRCDRVRTFHEPEPAALQMLNQMRSRDLRNQAVGLRKWLPTLEAQGK